MGIPTRLSCGAMLGCQGEEWWSYDARLHHICAKQHWLLRKKPTAGGGIPIDLSAFVPVTVVPVPT